MKFGENLKEIRKSKNISQEYLAEKLGVSRQSVSKWETGENYPSMTNIMCLCDIFKCKINNLVHEDFEDLNFLDEEIQMSVVKFKADKQRKVKGLSKAIYILARIGKTVSIIAIPFIIFAMVVVPLVLKNVSVEDNKIIISNTKIVTIEEKGDKVELKVGNLAVTNINNKNEILTIKDVLNKYSDNYLIFFGESAMVCLVVSIIILIYVFKHLENLFVNIYNGDTPFTLDNVQHIKMMAFLLIFSIVFTNLTGALFDVFTKMDLNIGLEVVDVVHILFLFSMAYIFEYGYEIQLDSKGKIYGKDE